MVDVDTDPTEPLRFSFQFGKRYLPMLAAIGVTPATAHAIITEDRLVVRFGPWLCSTSLTNIEGVCVTGPYHAVKAIGTRVSVADRGLTFGTNTDAGACLTFKTPVAGLDPLGVVRHPGLTLTVEDPEGFASAVRAAAGLTSTT